MIHALLIQTHARRVFFLMVIVLCAVGTTQAQFRASVQGSVRDANGAVVPGATIKLVSHETNKTQEVQSSDDGFYRVSGLTNKYLELFSTVQQRNVGHFLSETDNTTEGSQPAPLANQDR